MNLLHEQIALISAQFHWLRPWWLLSLIPILLLGILLWRQKRRSHHWQQLIAPELLPYLLDGKTISRKRSLLWGLIAAWCISAIALAGPSWLKRPTPVQKNQNALVILLDLSTSMVSEDIKPSRIVRARLKIADILRERKDGQAALIVYAGEAHTVTPISDDSATIVSLLPSLHPSLMPLPGSNTEAAVARGIELLKDAGLQRGDLLLITDGVVPEAFSPIRQLLAGKPIHLSILGVGSQQPAPIISPKGGFLRDKQGVVITTQLNSRELGQLAQQVGGRYSDIANNNSDIDSLLSRDINVQHEPSTLERDVDQWLDQGYWLVFLLLPMLLLSFKRGFILMLVCIPLVGLSPQPVYAFSLDDLWLTKDQQAQRALTAGDAKAAAEQFQTPQWKASAQYRAGDYAAAAAGFAQSDTAEAHYNRGNALAKSGDLEGAINAYDQALKRDPRLADAEKNRAIAEAARQQQKQQQQSSEQKQQDQQQQNSQSSSENSQSDQQQSNSQQQKTEKDNNQEQQTGQGEQQQTQNSSQGSASGQQQSSQEVTQSSASGHREGQQQASSASAAATPAAGQQQSSAATSVGNQSLAQSSDASDRGEENPEQLSPPSPSDNLSHEQKQALEQWLRRVPDDPGGLLRNKFRWQYQQNRQKKADGDFAPPPNNADQRW